MTLKLPADIYFENPAAAGGIFGAPGELFDLAEVDTGYTFQGRSVFRQGFTGIVPGGGFTIVLKNGVYALLHTLGWTGYAGTLRWQANTPVFPTEGFEIYVEVGVAQLKTFTLTSGGGIVGQPFNTIAWFVKTP